MPQAVALAARHRPQVMARVRARRRWRARAGQPQRLALSLVLRWCSGDCERLREELLVAEDEYRNEATAADTAWWLLRYQRQIDGGQENAVLRGQAECAEWIANACQYSCEILRQLWRASARTECRLACVCRAIRSDDAGVVAR